MESRRKYKHLFFDLDRTLWDFNQNSKLALTDILHRYQLVKGMLTPDHFYETYCRINDRFWALYRQGKMSKDVLRKDRFIEALAEYDIHEETLAEKISNDYITFSPQKTSLVPGTLEVMDYLVERYKLYIITNGFDDIQYVKLNRSGLDKYFTKTFTSEQVRSSKPEKEIFAHSLSAANAKKDESLMIGDDLEVDIMGAASFGIDQVYFNPAGVPHRMNPTYEIRGLTELKNIL